MKPLFSLDSIVSSIATPVNPAKIRIRTGEKEGVWIDGERTVRVIAVPETATLEESTRQIRSFLNDDAMPALVTMNEDGVPTGIISSHDLFASFLTLVQNQSVLLGTLMDTMSEAVTIVDSRNVVQHWNRAAQTIYEIDRTQVIGTSLDEHFASESIRLLDALRQGTSVQRVYHIPRPDSHVLINAAPIRLDGRIIGAISIEQDITELVRLNEELAHTTAHLHNLQQEMSRFQAADDPFYAIKGHSASIQSAISSAKKVAQTDATVLIYGESGVGKELFAKAIHQASRRREKPFIAINCGAIPAALFESELFGYQGGAFTGAEKKGKPGKLELAHGGTLFLDEIGELPLELQVKLLRALQERQFYRVGGTEPISVNTRIVAATNRQLEQMVFEGRFREDLYYRLNVFSLEVPPLRERREDLPELVQIFIHEYSVAHEQSVPRIAPEVMQALFDYTWPGNIRQLRNVIERLSILQENGVIMPEHLPSVIRSHSNEPRLSAPVSKNTAFSPAFAASPLPHNSYAPEPASSERERIVAALERTYGNKKAAAELLGMSRGTLYNKMRKYNINEGAFGWA
ncbi:sigma-54-dependent Fis family transcriptional regulator [Brevibacillus reuszeri]|uniref:Fis family transcriptional regulator n=1 Tax=Brevibacillus reuszeri TaxID=54915 RepID=A0A0K9Z132_9BACL|nr:sigma-54-dependent Fis family transcriptional regulator [Brevibacillus reuszeri]KNB74567.1 Fis family transcriptional regulator [Brevibacillus reuszeri]MED1856500.1 sigma-54-dependent Fis family transcriptional regulator [Brevibacillus reuszeri]GED67801.1 sigma-54-dependent Fis family transcriptional regulator [Brevibacillus reuszeri]